MQINNNHNSNNATPKDSKLVHRNNGQDFAIRCMEVTAMPSSDSFCADVQNKISIAMERQLNEQLFLSGAITKDLYEAAKVSFDKEAADDESKGV